MSGEGPADSFVVLASSRGVWPVFGEFSQLLVSFRAVGFRVEAFL